ncbi:hypothetical protein Aglo01_48110 [Actinokineospora globicatena]|nr:hypothetical protein Aglo01_48110 [Actinokineospora globicatena]GLW87158.1 hypothetical protein Aglo02_47970 [Actinokineospora globicatena]
MRDHYGALDLGVPGENGLDLPEFDSEATDLHLVVDPAQHRQQAVGTTARDVTGAVHARASGAERVGGKALGAQAGTSVVATRETVSGDVKLTGNANGDRLKRAVQHIDGRVRDRQADRDAVAVQLMRGRPDSGLGRPIEVRDATGPREVAGKVGW